MTLFNDKIIRKYTNDVKEIPEEHLSVIEQWVSQIKNGFPSLAEAA